MDSNVKTEKKNVDRNSRSVCAIPGGEKITA